jgi:uncharacterized Zn ribbon protein
MWRKRRREREMKTCPRCKKESDLMMPEGAQFYCPLCWREISEKWMEIRRGLKIYGRDKTREKKGGS